MGGHITRRTVLTGAAGLGGLMLAGSAAGQREEDGCTPGHDADDSPCQQVDDDAAVLTGFDATATALPVTFDYPCGWRTSTTDQFDGRSQANVTRDDFDAYASVQVRAYFEPVGAGFIDDTRESGDYDDVEFDYDGETRTGIVTSPETAAFGTTGHATVPVGPSLVHVELTSTLKGTACTQPRPDYDLVRDMLASLAPNRNTTFIEDSGRPAEYALAKIDPQRISRDDSGRIEVPPRADVLLPGITNLPPDTRLQVQVAAKQGEETTFFARAEGVEVRTAPNREWQSWEMTVADAFLDAAGTAFDIKILTAGVARTINPGPQIEGIVVETERVPTIEFTDKTSPGDVVVVDRIETGDGGRIRLTDADGTILGTSDRLAEETVQENLAVSLDDTLASGRHELTAIPLRPDGEPYPERAARTATITVSEGTLPATFRITSLDPTSATLTGPGDPLTVTAGIENAGRQGGNANVTVAVAGSVRATKAVHVNAGATTTVRFALDTAGLQAGQTIPFRVSTADDAASGTLSVSAAGDPTAGNGGTSPTGDDTSVTSSTTGTHAAGPGFGIGGALMGIIAALGLARWKQRE